MIKRYKVYYETIETARVALHMARSYRLVIYIECINVWNQQTAVNSNH